MKNFSSVVFLGLAVGLLNPAMADDSLKGGGYKNKSGDFPQHVIPSQSSRAPVAAVSGHHNDGGQDRGGRDWVGDVTPHSHEHPADAPSSPSLQQWGWNSK